MSAFHAQIYPYSLLSYPRPSFCFLTPPELAWASANDTKNPHNWSASRKWGVAILVSFYALSAPMSSAMVVPALPQMSEELGLTSEASRQLLISAYVLCWSLGTLLWGPLSEAYGRSALLNYGQVFFLLTNSLCALEWNGTRFLVLRSLSGLAGSAPLAVSCCFVAWISSRFQYDAFTIDQSFLCLELLILLQLTSSTADWGRRHERSVEK